MLIWMTLLLLGETDGSGEPAIPSANMFNRRRRRGFVPQA